MLQLEEKVFINYGKFEGSKGIIRSRYTDAGVLTYDVYLTEASEDTKARGVYAGNTIKCSFLGVEKLEN